MNAESTEGTRILHFPDRREAESFVLMEGFQYQGAPGRWLKKVGDEVVRADIHIGQYGTVVAIYVQPSPRPATRTE